MPRGGPRPNSGGVRLGAGRPKKFEASKAGLAHEVASSAACAGMSPLDYMLSVMRDPQQDPLRRDRMAVAAAPFVHPKASDAAPGKKEQRDLEAQTAERGTNWESLLN